MRLIPSLHANATCRHLFEYYNNVLFTCYSAGRTSPAVCGVFTHQTSPSLPPLLLSFNLFIHFFVFKFSSGPLSRLHLISGLIFKTSSQRSYLVFIIWLILKLKLKNRPDHSMWFITFVPHAPRIKKMDKCKIVGLGNLRSVHKKIDTKNFWRLVWSRCTPTQALSLCRLDLSARRGSVQTDICPTLLAALLHLFYSIDILNNCTKKEEDVSWRFVSSASTTHDGFAP